MYSCEFCNKSYDKYRSLAAHQCAKRRIHLIDVYNKNRDVILKQVDDGLPMIDIATALGLGNAWLATHMRKIGDYNRPDHYYSSVRSERIKKTCIDKYGVTNPAKLSHVKDKVKKTVRDRYGVSNATNSGIAKIKHYILGIQPDPAREEDYYTYRAIVDRLTRTNKELAGTPVSCYYSGITFDTDNDHFNHAAYPTIDHKTSVWYGFENNIPAEQIADPSNLVWCAKLLNTYKRHMTEEQFRVTGIIERFIKHESEIRNTR